MSQDMNARLDKFQNDYNSMADLLGRAETLIPAMKAVDACFPAVSDLEKDTILQAYVMVISHAEEYEIDLNPDQEELQEFKDLMFGDEEDAHKNHPLYDKVVDVCDKMDEMAAAKKLAGPQKKPAGPGL